MHTSPGISLFPANLADTTSLEFEVLPQAPARDPDAVEAEWRALRQRNPGLYDGSVLLLDLDDLRHARRVVRRGSFKAFIGSPAGSLRSVGVQGLVLARDAHGVDHLLLARRSSEVRMYPGLWENAPSGGVSPPTEKTLAIDQSHFVDALTAEALEELGLDLAFAHFTHIALLEDAAARSIDVVLKVILSAPFDPRSLPCPARDADRWEYVDAAWIALPDLPAWLAANTHAVSPPTRVLFGWLFSR